MHLENLISGSELTSAYGSSDEGGQRCGGCAKTTCRICERLFSLCRSINDDGLERCIAGPPSQKQLWQVVLRWSCKPIMVLCVFILMGASRSDPRRGSIPGGRCQPPVRLSPAARVVSNRAEKILQYSHSAIVSTGSKITLQKYYGNGWMISKGRGTLVPRPLE